jgi:2-methylcitrate dehydratase PrpD
LIDPIAETLATFVAKLAPQQIPEVVSQRARHLMLDAIGCAMAARREPFAQHFLASTRALCGSSNLSSGIIGFSERLPLRDAVLMNGVLMHGLDYDDTHIAGIIHLTVSALPTVLNLASQQGASGLALITAYICAIEAGARLASAAQGGFHAQGFHPTGLIGTFATALAAGKLMDLNERELIHAQGVALSMTSGSLQFLEDGSWTKRLHAGLAAQSGLAAASHAAHGVIAPQAPYLGRYGLYHSYLSPEGFSKTEVALATKGLDTQGSISEWELMNIAVKPFAMCHFVHAATDAAIAIHQRGLNIQDIVAIEVLVPQAGIEIVCEPAGSKRRPISDYDAKFSLPYAVVSGLMRGRLGLNELLPSAYTHQDAQALMDKVTCRADPDTTFPRHYTGEVRVTLKTGEVMTHREAINRGHPERAVSNEEVQAKFMENATLHFTQNHANAIREQVLALDTLGSVSTLEALLAQDP